MAFLAGPAGPKESQLDWDDCGCLYRGLYSHCHRTCCLGRKINQVEKMGTAVRSNVGRMHQCSERYNQDDRESRDLVPAALPVEHWRGTGESLRNMGSGSETSSLYEARRVRGISMQTYPAST